MDIYRLKISIGVSYDIITTPWFSGGQIDITSQPVIYQHSSHGERLLGKRNTYQSIAQFLKRWFTRERIYERMKEINERELKCDRHILVIKVEKFNAENLASQWNIFKIRGKLKSKISFHQILSHSVESALAYRFIAMGN